MLELLYRKIFGCSTRIPDTTCKHGPVQPYWQEMVLMIVVFGVLCVVLMRYVFPRMEQTFQARVDAIDGGIARAEATRVEAAAVLAAYRTELAGARADAAATRDAARADAATLRDGVLAAAREEVERILADGRQRLRSERDGVVRELRADVGALAVDLAGRVLGEPVDDQVRRRGGVESYLAG